MVTGWTREVHIDTGWSNPGDPLATVHCLLQWHSTMASYKGNIYNSFISLAVAQL